MEYDREDVPQKDEWFSEAQVSSFPTDIPFVCKVCNKILVAGQKVFLKMARLPDKTITSQGYFCEECIK